MQSELDPLIALINKNISCITQKSNVSTTVRLYTVSSLRHNQIIPLLPPSGGNRFSAAIAAIKKTLENPCVTIHRLIVGLWPPTLNALTTSKSSRAVRDHLLSRFFHQCMYLLS